VLVARAATVGGLLAARLAENAALLLGAILARWPARVSPASPPAPKAG